MFNARSSGLWTSKETLMACFSRGTGLDDTRVLPGEYAIAAARCYPQKDES